MEKVDELLASEPVGGEPRAMATHQRLPKLSIEYFLNENPEYAQNIDFESTKWREWPEKKLACKGMVLSANNEKHGIIRYVEEEGEISEATWRND